MMHNTNGPRHLRAAKPGSEQIGVFAFGAVCRVEDEIEIFAVVVLAHQRLGADDVGKSQGDAADGGRRQGAGCSKADSCMGL